MLVKLPEWKPDLSATGRNIEVSTLGFGQSMVEGSGGREGMRGEDRWHRSRWHTKTHINTLPIFNTLPFAVVAPRAVSPAPSLPLQLPNVSWFGPAFTVSAIPDDQVPSLPSVAQTCFFNLEDRRQTDLAQSISALRMAGKQIQGSLYAAVKVPGMGGQQGTGGMEDRKTECFFPSPSHFSLPSLPLLFRSRCSARPPASR